MKITDDPDGVMAVLQTARRLVKDSPELLKTGWKDIRAKGRIAYSLLGAVREAIDMVHPRDRERAWWTAHKALFTAVSRDETAENGQAHSGLVLTRWESHPGTTKEDALRVLDAAIKAQGQMNVAVSKAKGR